MFKINVLKVLLFIITTLLISVFIFLTGTKIICSKIATILTVATIGLFCFFEHKIKEMINNVK